MRIRKGFVMRSLGDENIIVPEGSECINFSKMLALNSTAAFLWEKAEGVDFTEEMLADFLTGKYEVSRELALADCHKLVQSWIEAGIIEL